jgi:uncharacterized protein YxeA
MKKIIIGIGIVTICFLLIGILHYSENYIQKNVPFCDVPPEMSSDYNKRLDEHLNAVEIISSPIKIVSDDITRDYKKSYDDYTKKYTAILPCSAHCIGGTYIDSDGNRTCICNKNTNSPVPYLDANGLVYCVNQDCANTPNAASQQLSSDLENGMCTCIPTFYGKLCLSKVKNMARYVRIQRIVSNGDDIINLAELQVFDKNGKDIALNKTVTSKSVYQSFDPRNIVDGNPSTFYHSNPSVGEWVMVDLGEIAQISSIKIVNRQDCCKERAIGLQVQLYGIDPTKSDRSLPIQVFNLGKTVKDVYEWTLTSDKKAVPV